MKRRNLLHQAAAASAASIISPKAAWCVDANIESKIKELIGNLKGELVVLYPDGCLANLQPVKKEFESQSSCKVRLKKSSLDEISSEMIINSKITSKESYYDIALPPTFSIPDLVESKTILDLSDIQKKYEPPGYGNSMLYPLGDRYLDRFYGYQTDGDAYILFLRRSWLENKNNQMRFKKAYNKELSLPQTWEELDRQIEFFHDPKKNKYGTAFFRNKNYLAWEYIIRLHAKGLLLFDENMKPLLTHAKAVEALEEMVRISKFAKKGTNSNGLFDNFKHYAEGETYCNLGWGGTQKYLRDQNPKLERDLIFLETPSGAGQKLENISYFNWGWNYVVSSKSREPEKAFLFCLLACSPKTSIESVSEAGGFLDPYRTEQYKDKKIIKTYGEKFLKTHEHAMRSSIPDLYIKGQGKYLSSLKEGLHLAVKDQLTPERALQSVAKNWEKLTIELGKDVQIQQWSYLRKSYPKKYHKAFGIK